ncbi:MAG: hypothetical protein ABGW76_11830 [Mesonia sp.]|uniref:hypothetical protein n=1 Tax=Mesonia sp. TaxID=1960830 RepID=UPI0032424BEF
MDSEMIIYQTEDGQTKIQTRLENETVWLSQEQMSELFQRERSVITKHIGKIFKEGELEEESNVQNLHISGSDSAAFDSAQATESKGKSECSRTLESERSRTLESERSRR